MNIFVVDADPVRAAMALPDKLIVKMPTESAQIMSTVAWQRELEAPMRPTHIHHPCTLWAGRSRGNWDWLLRHAFALCREYSFRYEGRVHAAEEALAQLEDLPIRFEHEELEPFVQALPRELQSNDPVQAYRRYLRAHKAYYARWERGQPQPRWWKEDAL